MPVQVWSAAACLGHAPGSGFPEQPARLEAVLAALRTRGTAVREAQPASRDVLELCHDPAYIDRLAAMSAAGQGSFDDDTPVDAATWPAALAAVGASLAALEQALAGDAHTFAAVRPPGHHALPAMAMGFCYLNQIALLAAEARRRDVGPRLIIDWDVHHGNGTQAMVADDPHTRFVSMHQAPWWPGSGGVDERGCGNCFNRPMAGGLPPMTYVESLWDGIRDATVDTRPELILISAGYDGMRGDPLGGFTLEPEHYALWVQRLRETFPDVPIVALLEGGYAPARVADGVLATLTALH